MTKNPIPVAEEKIETVMIEAAQMPFIDERFAQEPFSSFISALTKDLSEAVQVLKTGTGQAA